MQGKFDKQLILPDAGEIEVRGPFEADADEPSATIHFLIVQEGEEVEDRHAPADQTVTAVGQGTWSRGDKEWTGMVSPKGRLPNGEDGWLHLGLARGIGLAVAVKNESLTKDNPPKFDPPSYETLTWCADFHLVRPDAAS